MDGALLRGCSRGRSLVISSTVVLPNDPVTLIAGSSRTFIRLREDIRSLLKLDDHSLGPWVYPIAM